MRNWEEVRAKGKVNYIIKYGVIGWGMITGLAVGIFTEINALFEQEYSRFLTSLSISLAVFSVFGILFGQIMWYFGEKKYNYNKKNS
ncbi:hypothetical protein [Anoxybacillus ayderensis]|uniref:hypothetical protein n=1 Tax=Anoxybacillus ayderensis TaxID=265546 RepID=UPI002E22587E|nr:hypothetical protein [Anoxybacillus ayderensis]